MSGGPAKVRAVFDCMVFLQAAARRESPSGQCLLLVELEAIELYVCEEIVSEIQNVLSRQRVRKKFPALTDQLIGRFLAALRRLATTIPVVPRVFVYERDPKDEPYINLAIAAGANYLVTRDSDILALAEHDNVDTARFRSFAPHLRIVDPVSFLTELRQSRSN